jgi:hypothetical protein
MHLIVSIIANHNHASCINHTCTTFTSYSSIMAYHNISFMHRASYLSVEISTSSNKRETAYAQSPKSIDILLIPMFNIIHKAQNPLAFPYIHHSIPSNSYQWIPSPVFIHTQSPIFLDIPKVQPSLAFQTSTLLGPFPSKEDQDTFNIFISNPNFHWHAFFTYITCISYHASVHTHHISYTTPSTRGISCTSRIIKCINIKNIMQPHKACIHSIIKFLWLLMRSK